VSTPMARASAAMTLAMAPTSDTFHEQPCSTWCDAFEHTAGKQGCVAWHCGSAFEHTAGK
jgi:hypothetical protein